MFNLYLENQIMHPTTFIWSHCTLFWWERHNSLSLFNLSQIIKHAFLYSGYHFTFASTISWGIQEIQVQKGDSVRATTTADSHVWSEECLWSDHHFLGISWSRRSFWSSLLSCRKESRNGKFSKIQFSWSFCNGNNSLSNDLYTFHQEF